MTPEARRQAVEVMLDGEPGLFWVGFDAALVGVVMQGGSSTPRVCYEAEAMVAVLTADGSDEVEAREHLMFNVWGGYIGEGTPFVLYRTQDAEV